MTHFSVTKKQHRPSHRSRTHCHLTMCPSLSLFLFKSTDCWRA